MLTITNFMKESNIMSQKEPQLFIVPNENQFLRVLNDEAIAYTVYISIFENERCIRTRRNLYYKPSFEQIKTQNVTPTPNTMKSDNVMTYTKNEKTNVISYVSVKLLQNLTHLMIKSLLKLLTSNVQISKIKVSASNISLEAKELEGIVNNKSDVNLINDYAFIPTINLVGELNPHLYDLKKGSFLNIGEGGQVLQRISWPLAVPKKYNNTKKVKGGGNNYKKRFIRNSSSTGTFFYRC